MANERINSRLKDVQIEKNNLAYIEKLEDI